MRASGTCPFLSPFPSPSPATAAFLGMEEAPELLLPAPASLHSIWTQLGMGSEERVGRRGKWRGGDLSLSIKGNGQGIFTSFRDFKKSLEDPAAWSDHTSAAEAESRRRNHLCSVGCCSCIPRRPNPEAAPAYKYENDGSQ